MDNLGQILGIGLALFVFLAVVFVAIIAMFYRKVPQGKALVRTGFGGIKIATDKGLYVIPVFHKVEVMDISVKKIQVERLGSEGLVCKDNMRADIKVAYFVRVNNEVQAIKKVAQTIGCERASQQGTLEDLFESKFSEALKSVGKKFDFTDLYEARREFRDEIVDIIGTDLNGYTLEDCAIDYLEQTPIEFLSPNNILDAEGIKKITDLTATQNMKANLIKREEQKVIRKQDVEAQEAILELDRQLAEKEESQKREIANIKSREEAQILKVSEEERLKSESARIATEEKIQVAEENMQRQIIVAEKNKLRTDAVETERVEKDRALEQTERERIVTLAQIEKEKVVEIEKKNIQDVIRERVSLEKGVVTEKENMKDIETLRTADREKQVMVTLAEAKAEEELIRTIKEAEANKEAMKQKAEEINIEAQARKEASTKEADARKIIADAKAKEEATMGLSEAQVMHAKADASERQGLVDALIIEKKAVAEAKGLVVNAEAKRKDGLAEADVIREKAKADAEGIEEKAEAMKKLDGVGKEHEEFKLKLDKELQVELAQINIQKDIAYAQADVLGKAFEKAHIDIVGGDNTFFDNVVNQISKGKGFEKMIDSSETLQDVKENLLDTEHNGGNVLDKVKSFLDRYDISTEDIKNLTITGALTQLLSETSKSSEKSMLNNLLDQVKNLGLGNQKVKNIL